MLDQLLANSPSARNWSQLLRDTNATQIEEEPEGKGEAAAAAQEEEEEEAEQEQEAAVEAATDDTAAPSGESAEVPGTGDAPQASSGAEADAGSDTAMGTGTVASHSIRRIDTS